MWWIILAIWVFLLVKPKEKYGVDYWSESLFQARRQKMIAEVQKEAKAFNARYDELKIKAKKEKYERWNALEFDDGC